MKYLRSSWLLVLLTVGLSGCATTAIESLTKERSYDGLYLRGVFSWWEADEKYKLKEVSPQRYATQIELIADGQPYDFKFADALWTPGFNCGYQGKSDQIISTGSVFRANCDSTDENFRFTPKESGTYQFIIDFGGFGAPKVEVLLISAA